jgi:hypothetical protein
MNTFFQKKANVTRIPTPQNFAHYVDNNIYEMKQHLNTSRLLIIGLLISQLVSGIVLAGLINFVINEPAENYFQDGDIVLVLKQSTMDHSGQIGVVIYDDDKATLKRIEYVIGEDWMKLSPINPQFPPVMVREEALEHCRVLGIPKMLVRKVN